MLRLDPDVRVTLKKMTRSMASTCSDLPKRGYIDFKNEAKALAAFGAALAEHEGVNDPDMTAALIAYERLRQTLSDEFERAMKQQVHRAHS